MKKGVTMDLLVGAVGTGAVIAGLDLFRNRDILRSEIMDQIQADNALDIHTKMISALKASGRIVVDQKKKDIDLLKEWAMESWENREKLYQQTIELVTRPYTLNRDLFRSALTRAYSDPLSLIVLPASFTLEALGFFTGLTLPDIDITLLGIGGHRNWFTHSALPPYMLNSIFSKVLSTREEQRHQSATVKLMSELIRMLGAPLLAGYCYGTGIHLMLDAVTPKDIVGFPIGSLLSGGTMVDSAYLFANGLACFDLGNKNLMLAQMEAESMTKLVIDGLAEVIGVNSVKLDRIKI